MKILSIAIMCLFLLAAGSGAASAQTAGPVAPPPKYEVKRVPAQPVDVKAPPIPADEIIRRFAANEDVMKKAFDQFSFNQTIRIKEMSDPAGEFAVTGELYVKSDGQRYDRIVKQPVSTLKQTAFTLEDVKTIANLPLFALTTDQLTNYTLKYEGTEKLDELNTYIFRVQPKQLMRNRPLFDGVVWVDQQEFAIVKSSGKFVREVATQGNGLPFSMFDTYRENIKGKYWFPTYTVSDDFVSEPNGQNLPLHLVVRSTDFQPNPIEVAPSSAPAAPAPPPSPKPN
ncbi:MAG: hypothetical protein WB787_01475 [Candidatus Acidiferrales bacterium]